MCAVHVTILGLLARSSDFYAERGSEVRALKSADGPNPNFAPNIYIVCTFRFYRTSVMAGVFVSVVHASVTTLTSENSVSSAPVTIFVSS